MNSGGTAMGVHTTPFGNDVLTWFHGPLQWVCTLPHLGKTYLSAFMAHCKGSAHYPYLEGTSSSVLMAHCNGCTHYSIWGGLTQVFHCQLARIQHKLYSRASCTITHILCVAVHCVDCLNARMLPLAIAYHSRML